MSELDNLRRYLEEIPPGAISAVSPIEELLVEAQG